MSQTHTLQNPKSEKKTFQEYYNCFLCYSVLLILRKEKLKMVFIVNKLRQNSQIVSRIQSIQLNSGPVEVRSPPSVSK